MIDRPMDDIISLLETHERRKEWDRFIVVSGLPALKRNKTRHGKILLSERSERTLYSCQLRFPIYIGIYVRVVRVSCVLFSPYIKETPLRIILGILEISGKFNVRGSLRFYS